MAHPQTRVAPTSRISCRPAKVLHQKEGEVMAALVEVFGIHRAQGRIAFHAFIETCDDALKRGRAAGHFVNSAPVLILFCHRIFAKSRYFKELMCENSS